MTRLLTVFITLCLSVSVASAADTPDIKITSEIKKSGYVGETFELVTTLVSSSPDISNVRILQQASFPDGIKVIKGIVRNSRPSQIKEKGKILYSWTVQREFIIPSKSGKFNIGEARYVAFIPHEKIVYQNFWGPRRIIDYEEVQVLCPAVSFKVNVLPAARPSDFTGCIGDFEVEAWFPPGRIQVGNEAIAIFKISGFGSLEDFKVPNLSKLFAAGCQLKEVDRNEEQSQKEGSLYNEVTLACRFIPTEYDFSISPLCVSFFSPTQNKYYSACSDALTHTDSGTPRKQLQISKDAIEI